MKHKNVDAKKEKGKKKSTAENCNQRLTCLRLQTMEMIPVSSESWEVLRSKSQQRYQKISATLATAVADTANNRENQRAEALNLSVMQQKRSQPTASVHFVDFMCVLVTG